MGDYQLAYTAIGALIFVAAIIGGRMFVVSNFVDADIHSATTTRELNAMSVSYKVLDCFKDGGDSVTLAFLNTNANRNLCDICEDLCTIIAEASVTDLESEPISKWDFEYSELATLPSNLLDKLKFWDAESDHKTFSVYIDIAYESDSHVGRLDVNV